MENKYTFSNFGILNAEMKELYAQQFQVSCTGTHNSVCKNFSDNTLVIPNSAPTYELMNTYTDVNKCYDSTHFLFRMNKTIFITSMLNEKALIKEYCNNALIHNTIDQYFAWNEIVNGLFFSQATYNYVIEITSINENKHQRKGNITIL